MRPSNQTPKPPKTPKEQKTPHVPTPKHADVPDAPNCAHCQVAKEDTLVMRSGPAGRAWQMLLATSQGAT